METKPAGAESMIGRVLMRAGRGAEQTAVAFAAEARKPGICREMAWKQGWGPVGRQNER
jgi:hypothetical protein